MRVFYSFRCYYHHHHCNPAANILKFPADKVRKKLKFDRLKREYVTALNYRTLYMHECVWTAFLKDNPDQRQRIKAKQTLKYEGPAWDKGPMTEAEIQQLVATEELFGFVRVDIDIEDEALKERCKEFSPFFKHAEITRRDLGKHMRTFAEEAGMLKTPQRALIGAMHAEDFWVGTPLLKWYLDLGCTVKRIYEVVQYEGQVVFDKFVDDITDTRREADSNPQKAIHGENAKVTGLCVLVYFVVAPGRCTSADNHGLA